MKQQDSIAIRSGDDKVECANQRPQKVPMVLRAQNFRTATRKNISFQRISNLFGLILKDQSNPSCSPSLK